MRKSFCCGLVAALFVIVCAPGNLFAQGTAFTYQGHLNAGGFPASGNYDLSFALYNAGLGGASVGGPITNAATVVSNGLFTTTLDFGAAPFDGSARWLEIGVRTNGDTGDFALLSPRQFLASSPYAVRAGIASAFTGAVADSQLTPNIARLSGSSQSFSGQVNFNNASNTFAGNGAGLSNLNASAISSGTLSEARLPGTVAMRSGGNIFQGNQLIPSNSVAIGTLSVSRPLNIRGNGDSGEWVSFSGTNDVVRWHLNNLNGGLNFSQSSVSDARLFLATNGNVGVGMPNPSSKLTVGGMVESQASGFKFPDGSVQTKAVSNATHIVASVNMQFSQDDRSGWTHVEDLGDDTVISNIPLGFTYTGFGINTSVVSISSNGILFFGNNGSSALFNTQLPTAISTDAMLFFFWDDLKDYGAGEFMEYTTLGSPGGRVFNLYFRNRLFSPNCSTNGITVMISIHEGSGLIKATYSGFSGCSDLRGGSATLGFQTPGGSSATAFTVGVDSPVLDDNTPGQSMSFHPPN
jgi:hypothetical protein